MLSPDHELILQLFRDDPTLVPRLLAQSLGVEVPAFAAVRIEAADFTDMAPAGYHADLVVTLRDRSDRALMAVVVEVQRHVDERKWFAWPLYQASEHARARCLTYLLVITLDPAVARWARQPIRTLPRVAPLVIGPEEIPRVGVDEAERLPELAMLSVQVHGNDPGAADVLTAAAHALLRLPEDRATLYYDWVLSVLDEAARRLLEVDMEAVRHEYRSEFARKYVAEGEAKGRTEGRAEGRVAALLDVLDARGIALTSSQRARIEECRDLAMLALWMRRALEASAAAEVLAPV